MAEKHTSSAHNRGTKSVEECQAMIHTSFRTPMVRLLREGLEKAGCGVEHNFFKAGICNQQISGAYVRAPMVRFLRERLEKAGCGVQDNFFKAVICNQPAAGGYISGEGVHVCSNYIRIQDEVNQVVTHELIHAFDDCRAANLDWEDCAHHACSEIRANHLSGDCHYKRELLRGFMKLRGHGEECVRRRALQSLSANPNCSGLAAKDSMEVVWDVCYNDTQPFDRAP